jgi:transposase
MEPGKSGMYDYEYRQSYMDRSKKTQEFFQNNKHWLKILYFPPATPDRNPAEYCWKATREGLTSIKSFKI